MKVTINEIAKLANVSKSTISRVLNESGPVSKKTKRAVMDAVEALNFQPNEIARSLATKRTKTLGLVIQDIRNPYYATACWYSERIFRNYGYTTFICNADNNPDTEENFLNSMKYRNVDGIMCIGIQESSTSILRFKKKEDIPLVLIDRYLEDSGIHSVKMDNVYGGQLVVEYLFSLGHKNIAFITSDFTEAEQFRFKGFEKAMNARGMHIEDQYVVSQSEELWHKGTCNRLIKLLHQKDRPTALFASNDYKAIRVLRLLKQTGIIVPDEVSLVGYDDIETASLVDPALTTVHQPIDKMIEIGAKMLLSIIEKRTFEHDDNKNIMLKPWLVERESTIRVR